MQLGEYSGALEGNCIFSKLDLGKAVDISRERDKRRLKSLMRTEIMEHVEVLWKGLESLRRSSA